MKTLYILLIVSCSLITASAFAMTLEQIEDRFDQEMEKFLAEKTAKQ